ncbi:MAG: M24 family metallopeptidase, partial [Nitrospirota bacterium]
INRAGYKENYGHAGGHGIGLDIHESPSLSAKYTKKLRKNSVITIEPGIYLRGEFGVRIEDMILLGKKTINLTKTSKQS